MRNALPVLLAMLFLASCREPQSREYFQRSSGTGEFSFEFEMADTLCAYDISFYSAIDRPLFRKDTLVSFPLQIVWRSPSGRYFSETVYYPADSNRVRYRSGVIPSESGTWAIGVTIPDEPRRMRGLGIIVEKVGL